MDNDYLIAELTDLRQKVDMRIRRLLNELGVDEDTDLSRIRELNKKLSAANAKIESLHNNPLVARMANKLADSFCELERVGSDLAFVEELFCESMRIMCAWCDQPQDWTKERWYRYMLECAEKDYNWWVDRVQKELQPEVARLNAEIERLRNSETLEKLC